jgi:hypothetical protein
MSEVVDQAKSAALGEARLLLSQRMDFEFTFDFFEMLLANNELHAAGYAITNANREEKYLEVVNSGDEALLDKLKMFLDTYDRLGVHLTFYGQYKNLKKALESASTVDEVNFALEEYQKMFN